MPSSRPPPKPPLRPSTSATQGGLMTEPLWTQLLWQRPLDPVRVADLRRRWAAGRRSPRFVREVRVTKDGASYLLGCATAMRSAVHQPLFTLPNLTIRSFESSRPAIVA